MVSADPQSYDDRIELVLKQLYPGKGLLKQLMETEALTLDSYCALLCFGLGYRVNSIAPCNSCYKLPWLRQFVIKEVDEKFRSPLINE